MRSRTWQEDRNTKKKKKKEISSNKSSHFSLPSLSKFVHTFFLPPSLHSLFFYSIAIYHLAGLENTSPIIAKKKKYLNCCERNTHVLIPHIKIFLLDLINFVVMKLRLMRTTRIGPKKKKKGKIWDKIIFLSARDSFSLVFGLKVCLLP